MHYSIAPSFKGKSCTRLDLNRQLGWIAERDKKDGLPNGLLDPYILSGVLDRLHQSRCLIWSFGGYFETRGGIWDQTYIALEGKILHLGVDFNFPVGTEICVSHACEIVLIDDDHPEPFGWGKRIIIKILGTHEPIYLIYAHCDLKMDLRVGDLLTAGSVMAAVAVPEKNGGWYPHVHVQAMIGEAFDYYITGGKLAELDGYGHPNDLPRL